MYTICDKLEDWKKWKLYKRDSFILKYNTKCDNKRKGVEVF